MPYLPLKPASGDNLSVSQGDIQSNFSTANTVMDINHYPFDNTTNSKGKHKFVAMPVLGSLPTTISGEGDIYTKTSSVSQLFFTQDNSGNEYQLTRCIPSSYTLFSNNTNNYNLVGTNFTGGWSFLPGGMLIQYGNYNRPAGISPSIITVVFPVAFTNAATVNVIVTPICKAGGTSATDTFSLIDGSITTTQFQWNAETSTSSYVGVTWIAIGK